MLPQPSAGELRNALEAIERQDFRDYKLVALCDGRFRGLSDIVASEMPDAQTLKVPAGASDARQLNAAIEHSDGRYMVFLNPGDNWHPRYLSYQHAVFETLPDALYSRTGLSIHDTHSGAYRMWQRPTLPVTNPALDALLAIGVPTRSSLAVSRSLLIRSGGFSHDVGRFADMDLELRLLGGFHDAGPLACELHPTAQVSQLLVLAQMATQIRDLGDRMAGWFHDFRIFSDVMFSYPFMKRFQEHRQWIEARFIEEHCYQLRSAENSLRAAQTGPEQ